MTISNPQYLKHNTYLCKHVPFAVYHVQLLISFPWVIPIQMLLPLQNQSLNLAVVCGKQIGFTYFVNFTSLASFMMAKSLSYKLLLSKGSKPGCGMYSLTRNICSVPSSLLRVWSPATISKESSGNRRKFGLGRTQCAAVNTVSELSRDPPHLNLKICKRIS